MEYSLFDSNMCKFSPVAKPESYDTFPALDDITHGDMLALSLSNNTTSLTHGLHRFPAKFVPQIPYWAIEQFSRPGAIVLDPFAGSGTTLVEALSLNRNSIGIDIDPLNMWLCKVKTQTYDMDRLTEFSENLFKPTTVKHCNSEPLLSGIRDFEHWFDDVAQNELLTLYKNIASLPCTENERLFFFCVFSSILRKVSRADDQTQKTYVSGTMKKTPPPVLPTFMRNLERALKGVAALNKIRPKDCAAQVLRGSAADIPLKNDTVDLIATSPPYLDSVDYMYNFMLEYFWLGSRLGLQSRSDFNQGRRQAIGSKSPMVPQSLPALLNDLIPIEKLPPYRKKAIESYFSMMQRHFIEASRVLKRDGTYVLVVGNSQTENGIVPVHDALILLAQEAGLYLRKAFGYRIRRHYMKFPRKGRGGIIAMDWVIVLDKTKRNLQGRLPMSKVQIAPNDVAN